MMMKYFLIFIICVWQTMAFSNFLCQNCQLAEDSLILQPIIITAAEDADEEPVNSSLLYGDIMPILIPGLGNEVLILNDYADIMPILIPGLGNKEDLLE